jgi:hypothetical protein
MCLLAKDNRTLLFLDNGDIISINNKKIKRHVAWFGNFVYHTHNSNKMFTCTFCRIKRLKNLSSGCVLRKWKKVREPPVMKRRPKPRILELVIQRQHPIDAREKKNKKR